MPKETVKLEVPVVLKVDRRSVSDTKRDFRKLQSDLAKSTVDWTKLSKVQQVNARQLMEIGKLGSSLGTKISKAAQDSTKKLGQLGKAIKEAEKEASDVAKRMAETSDPKVRAGLAADASRLRGVMAKLNKQVQGQSKVYQSQEKSILKAARAQQAAAGAIGRSARDFDIGSVFKGILGGMKKGGTAGLGEAAGAVGKGAVGAAGRGASAVGAGPGTLATMGSAVTIMGGAVAAIGAFIKLLAMASDHMTGLNKALLKGTGLAADLGMSAEAYRKSVDDIRGAAIDAAGSMLRFGVNSEKALTDINAFAASATGSIRKTEMMLQQIGGGSLQKGVKDFATAAAVYGRALGVESSEVAKMMGDFVSDIGISHENVVSVMGDIVKTAAVANIPVHKMMDVFHDVIPDVDLFTNRIEELTGSVKLLSKTMDARAMKSFMKTMGKGFDELDFKQRLKMAFVIGPEKVAGILDKDFRASGKALSKEFKGLGPELESALDSIDPVKAMASVAAKAGAAGVSQAAIRSAQELARNKAASKKGVLGTATAMRGAGMYARMNMLEEYAGKFTGGDISGLGEHVAKQLGVSESEYKAILALKDNMAMYQASLSKTGRTSSKSMNESLKKLWKVDKLGVSESAVLSADQEKAFTQAMKDTATDPAAMKDMLQKAAAIQATETEAAKESMEDLAAEQYNVTSSIGDKLESVVGYFLEKIFNVLQPILSVLEDLFDAVTGDKAAKAQAQQHKMTVSAQTEAANVNEKRQKEILKGFGGTKEMQTQLAGMTSVLKDASGKTDPKQFAEAAMPVLNQVGKMTVDAFDKQTEKLKASGEKSILRGDTKASAELREKLVEIEKAKKMGASEDVIARLEHQAEQTVEGAVKAMVSNKQGVTALNALGSLAGGVALSGGGAGSIGDLAATASSKKQTEAMKKAADLVGATGDVDHTFLAAMGGMAGVSPALAAGVPPGAGAAATKTPQPPPGHDDQIKVLQDSGKSQETIAKIVDDDYQATSDTLAIMKKGLRFEQSWMNTKFKNVLKEATLEAFRTALLEQTVIYAKMWDDKKFRDAFADGGKDILASGVGLADFAGVARDSDTGVQEILDKAKAHATGLMGVPYDNYLASLHKGEMVMPASAVRSARGGGGKSTNVVVYATGVPASEVARRIGSIANSD